MTMMQQQTLPELDYRLLDKELDRVKTRVFMGKNAAFLGPLMCSVDFIWSTELPTAGTNGLYLKWNPYYFHFLPPEGRISILVHELWHVGLLHPLRRGDRDPTIWNAAVDTVLDNMMDLEGYCVDGDILFPPELFPPGSKTFVNHAEYGTKSAEEIYDMMIQNPPPPAKNPLGGDLIEPSKDDKQTAQAVINNVVAAAHAAKISGAGKLPGELEETINKFLKPKLPWEQILYNFFNELTDQDYSWARPNRRYQDMYLPTMMNVEDGLEHIMYFLDVSGSISSNDIIRFHSEFKHVKETFQPEKMTMVQFDTKIQKEDVFLKDDPFVETQVIGRGGTSLVCVRDHILKHNPTAVVVFSDLECNPMEPLPNGLNIPIIWIALNNRSATVHQGQLVHLKD